MLLYNFMECSDKYLKTFGSLRQNYRDEPFINNNGVIIDVRDNLDSPSFKYKQNITGEIRNNGTNDVQIIVLLKVIFGEPLNWH